jgi:alkylation response protein AidB-like acyl-CoA dehydrogenase
MSYKAPIRDMQFVMDEVLDFPTHYQSIPQGENASPEMVNAIIQEAAKFAENVLAPLNKTGDEEGCKLVDGQVITPSGFKEAYFQYVDNGWIGLPMDESIGGQGLPTSLGRITFETQVTANHAWTMYPDLASGAIKTIQAHGDESLQAYLPNMVSGKWSGTMCLTEPHCGSDLGLLRTKAVANKDGSYNITGNKIFISSGDTDIAENIIHIVLARLPDSPAGVKGISLFLVPKIQVKENGKLGEKNGVTCNSLEEKLGIHANATCSMNFEGAKGYLIGEVNKGMSCMFTFINESRLAVAQQAHGHIEASFQKALAYAQDRIQMRAPKRKDPQQPADPIIVHPDVRRMLLTQKAFSEGARLLNYYCAQQVDIAHGEGSDQQKLQAQTLLAFLTPVAKGFISEVSQEATGYGIQILGGHGFIRESGLEQEYRDTRITTIYEGTTGIQGLDLLGRKILASKGEVMLPFVNLVRDFCEENSNNTLAKQAENALNTLLTLTDTVASKASDPDEINGVGVDYLMFAGYTVFAYFWAKAAVVSEEKIKGNDKESEFYQAKIDTAHFYFAKLLPRTKTLEATIIAGSAPLMAMNEDSFSF